MAAAIWGETGRRTVEQIPMVQLRPEKIGCDPYEQSEESENQSAGGG